MWWRLLRWLERWCTPTIGEMGSYQGVMPLPPLVQMVVFRPIPERLNQTQDEQS